MSYPLAPRGRGGCPRCPHCREARGTLTRDALLREIVRLRRMVAALTDSGGAPRPPAEEAAEGRRCGKAVG